MQRGWYGGKRGNRGVRAASPLQVYPPQGTSHATEWPGERALRAPKLPKTIARTAHEAHPTAGIRLPSERQHEFHGK
jgi:hypothetical protein